MLSSKAFGFEDDEGCLMCHKYQKLGRLTEDGIVRTYQIVPEIFDRTVHRNVPCTDCHDYIKQLPHEKVEKGVSCDMECHSIKNPATGKLFSHKIIYNKYRNSVHGRNKIETGLNSDKPYCINCHTNPLYNPHENSPPSAIVDRCVVCHENQSFVTNWYKHTSRRIKEVKRTPEEIVNLCSNCHGNEEMIKRHIDGAKHEGRELGRKFEIASKSYYESFHGKVTRYGYRQAANCLDCHAKQENYYLNVHDIQPTRSTESPVHINNKVETCKRCHTKADSNYVKLDPHPTSSKDGNEFRYYANMIYGWVGDVVIVLLIGMGMIETYGRRRDGVIWRMKKGSSWWRSSLRGRNRLDNTDK